MAQPAATLSPVRSAPGLHPPGLPRAAGWMSGARFAALVLMFLALHALLEWPALDAPLFGLNAATADVAIAWLSLVSVSLVREGTMVLHAQGFVTEVHQVCTLLLPAALLTAGIAMHPHGRVGDKLAGMLLGVALVAVVNQCRLVGVIWVGVMAPDLFGAVHGWLAPAWLVALTTAYGWVWSRTVCPKVSP